MQQTEGEHVKYPLRFFRVRSQPLTQLILIRFWHIWPAVITNLLLLIVLWETEFAYDPNYLM